MTVQSGAVYASDWMDNKVVTVLYAGSSPLDETTVERTQRNGTRLSVPCPEAVSFYNLHMGVGTEGCDSIEA